MYIQRTLHKSSYCLKAFLLCLCLGFSFNNSAFANSADWGLVNRFEGQLEQAQNGKVKAMYEVGRLFERGRGTNKSLSSAASWYEKASDAGHSSAKARLGKMYLEGRGVNKDMNKAYKLISAAANSDVPGAQYQLGLIYEIGIGRKENNSKALFWYKKAAGLGHYQAERKVGQLKNANSSPFIAGSGKKTASKAKSKQAAKNVKPRLSLQSIAKGSWKRNKKPVGYLPSSINNCKIVNDKIRCVSSEQERSTGSEIITFSTESSIIVTGKNKFNVKYINNVLEVEVLKTEDVSGVEDEEVTETASTSISKGKQEKIHKLKCTLNSKKAITCTKGGFRTLKFSS